MYFTTLWVKSSPADNRISNTFSLREIATHQELDYKKHCRGFFGKFVHSHVDGDITNNMQPRIFSGPLLGLTGNMQDTYKVFDLNTDKVEKQE